MQKTLKKRGLNQVLTNELFIILLITLVAFASFGLGRLSAKADNTNGIKINYREENADKAELVASISGTKYHYPWCAGASKIKEKNKIFFNSAKSAEEAGFLKAKNCKGLK